MTSAVHEAVVDDVRRRLQRPASVAGDDDGEEKRDGAATSGHVWAMDLLDYYAGEHANNGPSAVDDAVPLALWWRRTQRHRGAASIPADIGRNSTELELQTAVIDLDGSRRQEVPVAAAGRQKRCAVDPDGGTTWNDEDCRRPIRSLADRLMSNKPCDCDTPDGCLFYAGVTSTVMAEARAAFDCRATKTGSSAVAATTGNDVGTTTPDERQKTTRIVFSAWDSLRRFKNNRKPDERTYDHSAIGAAPDDGVKKKSTKNVKHIQVAYKK